MWVEDLKFRVSNLKVHQERFLFFFYECPARKNLITGESRIYDRDSRTRRLLQPDDSDWSNEEQQISGPEAEPEAYFKCQEFILSSCEQLSPLCMIVIAVFIQFLNQLPIRIAWFELLYDVCLCFWREDHLSVWKLHEQQQARRGVRLPPAEFRPGE